MVYGGSYTTISTVYAGTTYTDNNVIGGTKYYYVVSAVSAGVESKNCAEVAATPATPTPTPEPTPVAESDVALRILLEKGEKVHLNAFMNQNATEDIIWTSTDEAIASVDSNGIVTAISQGRVMISAKLADGTWQESAYIKVVDGSASKLRLGILLKPAQTCNLIADFEPEDAGKTVTWISDNTNVATVSQEGRVTAISEGYAFITFKIDGTNITKYPPYHFIV